MLAISRDLQNARCRKHMSLCLAALSLLTPLLPIWPAMPLLAQTLEIKLMDGRNGRPMVGPSSYVNVWVGTERKGAITIPSDGKGVARLQLTSKASEVNIPSSQNVGSMVMEHPVVRYDELLRINAPYAWCAPAGSNYSWLALKDFSTKEVLDHGYASANTCGRPAFSPHPGQIILFVRPLTLWERLKE